jgi:hypothetical protein
MTLPVARARTTTPKRLATLDAPSGAAAGARLIQPDGFDSKSAAEVAVSLADALEELRRLKRSLDRRIRRNQVT